MQHYTVEAVRKMEVIEAKMPFGGTFVGEVVQSYLGKQGGYIFDGQLKNLIRRLSDTERAWWAEEYGLVKNTVRGKVRWDGDLQTDQTPATRQRRLESGCCPMHGVPFYQEGSWEWYDGNGDEIDVCGCDHCQHCTELKATARIMSASKCLVCDVTALVDRDWKAYLTAGSRNVFFGSGAPFGTEFAQDTAKAG
jgi:hypothetical protein